MNSRTMDDRAATEERRGTDWRTFIVLGLVLAVTQLGSFITTAALPLYLHDHGAPQGRIGFDVGLGSVASLVGMLALGPVLDRHGARLFMQLGGLLYVVAAVGMFLLPYEIPVTVFRVLQGVGALTIPSALSLGAKLMPDRPGTALGLLGAANTVSLAIGPPVGLALYTSHGAVPLFIASGVAAVVGLLLTYLVPRHQRGARRSRGFGFDRVWGPTLAVNALSAMYFGGIVAYLPLFLQKVRGPNAGIFFTADAIGVLLLRIPTGILADRYGSLIPKLIGVLVTLPGIAVLALPPTIFSLSAGGAWTGIGAGLFITGVSTDLARLSTDANRGTALSMGAASFNAAIFIGSAVSGLLIGPFGFNAILLFGAITCAAALPFVLVRVRALPVAMQ